MKNKFNYTGVRYSRNNNTYFASITINGTDINSRGHKTPELAAKSYDLLCIKYNRSTKNGFYSKLNKL